MKNWYTQSRANGYFLVIAVIFILVIGTMGTIITYLFSNRALLSVAQQNGLRAFYYAESGIEIGARLLTMPSLTGTPSRIACNNLSGRTANTNASLGSGTFTITTVNSSPIFATDTLNTAVTATDTTINAVNSSGFSSSGGRLIIDGEAMDYAAISGNSFIAVTRGTAGTTASSHATGAGIGQYQCNLDVQSFIPNSSSANYKRELQANVQLQDGWIAGSLSLSNFVLLHWNQPAEMSWNTLTVAGGTSTANINGISMLSNADGWAVTNTAANKLNFLHWNGTNWQLSTLTNSCSTQNLLSISMVSSQQGWAVGSRYLPSCSGSKYRYNISYWNGSTWRILTPNTSPNVPIDNKSNRNLNAVHVISTAGTGLGNLGFAVGDSGTILQYSGTNWIDVSSPTNKNLNGIYIVSSAEAWAVGDNGTILSWNGSTWSVVSSPTSANLNAIVMFDSNGNGHADYGWAVGDTGVIAAYNGSSWSASGFSLNNLLSVDLFTPTDVWAAGTAGTLLHWDGNAWSSINSGTLVNLNSISLVGPSKNPVSTWKQIFH